MLPRDDIDHDEPNEVYGAPALAKVSEIGFRVTLCTAAGALGSMPVPFELRLPEATYCRSCAYELPVTRYGSASEATTTPDLTTEAETAPGLSGTVQVPTPAATGQLVVVEPTVMVTVAGAVLKVSA